MRNLFLLCAILLISAVSSAQQQATKVVDDYIKKQYNEPYTVVQIDTVAMPIRLAMSLNFAATLDMQDAAEKLNTITTLKDHTYIKIGLRQLVEKMEQTISGYITPLDIIKMRKSNTRHEDDYYNYQRTKVYLCNSQREEVIYVRLGEGAVSMNWGDYYRLESEAILKYNQYENRLKELKSLLEKM